MAVHKCNHEEDFGSIKTKVEDLEKIVKGNGKPGLQETVTELNTMMKELKPEIAGLKTAISGFNKFQTESEVMIREEEGLKAAKRIKTTNKQWLIGIMVGILIVVIEKVL